MPFGIKICGLRDPSQAAACAAAGADAIGLVFHPASPRHVCLETARAVVDAIAGAALPVAVGVDLDSETWLRLCDQTGIRWVQLHGAETPELVERLAIEGLRVIKSLRASGEVMRDLAGRFGAAAVLLVECGSGPLPGGNGVAWDWAAARPLAGGKPPLMLAGGLTPENVAEAIRAAAPDAVDVSSGVEQAPGEKSILRVQAFIRAVRSVPATGGDGCLFR